MLSYLETLRPANCIMTAVAVLIGGFLITGADLTALVPVGYAMVSAFMITGAGNAINDWKDIEADRVNRPGRPIPSGRAKPKMVLLFSVALFAAGMVIGILINWATFIIAAINSVLLYVYSHSLQNKILMGNIIISYLVGSAFLFGGAALGNFTLPLLLMLLAALANLSREIIKDLEDVEGDKIGFLKRIVSRMGNTGAPIAERFGLDSSGVGLRYNRRIPAVAAVSLALAIVVSPLPYLLHVLSRTYLFLLIPTDIVFFMALLQIIRGGRKTSKKYKAVSKLIKTGMLLGLLAFIAGVMF